MILTDNITELKKKAPDFWNFIREKEQYWTNNEIGVSLSKNGLPILYSKENNTPVYIHSQYDPTKEAEMFIGKYEDVHQYQHVFFYGIGLGYHIEAFMKSYPNLSFSMYEPNPSIFYSYLSNKLLNALPLNSLKNIYIEWAEDSLNEYSNHFLQNLNEKVLFVIHPRYEQIYPQKAKQFSERFIQHIANHRVGLQVNERFQKLWTINSLVNFNKILKTENIIREKKVVFRDKPAVIVSAGPSLQEEFDNLKMIKEKGLAYIFAVGSANKALLANGIYPDAVLAYDPETGFADLDTFGEIINNNITSIPLIFGSTLGHVTVDQYPGPMFHMFINQDTISSFYLGEEEIVKTGEIVSDAPSIAVVTLELLFKLGCNPVILVGQNFGFKNDQYYAPGIQYASRPNTLLELEKQELVSVESVDGGRVYTNKVHNISRESMEAYIAKFPQVEVLNTTQGGALIKGSKFVSFRSIIEERLSGRVVVMDWYKGTKATQYNKKYIRSQATMIDQEQKNMEINIKRIIAQFRKLDTLIKYKNINELNKQFPIFDKQFKKVLDNRYYNVFIQPMIRVQHQLLFRSIPNVRDTTNPILKGEKIIEIFGKFIFECKKHMDMIKSDFIRLEQILLEEKSELYEKTFV